MSRKVPSVPSTPASRRIGPAFLLAALLGAVAAPALAGGRPPAPMMETGSFTLAPMPSVRFCLDYPEQCRSDGASGPVALTSERRQELQLVNAEVNASLVPRLHDGPLAVWRVDATEGDCNDYALQKRDRLLRLGWPASALLLAVVETRGGEGHLVLTVRTEDGDLVLDNLRRSVRLWTRTGYHWIKRQVPSEPRLWATLR